MTTTAHLPRAFGPYTLISSLGRGGMGEVFLAKSGSVVGAEQLCVVKTLRGDLAESREYAGRFLDEARIVVQLSHANICHVFDVGQVGAEYYIAMEFIPGVNLRVVLATMEQQRRKIDPGTALHVAVETLDALAYAHRQVHRVTGKPLNLVHRDVSPHNLMVSFEGEIKLIDFGLAESEIKEEHTATQEVLGKVAYMSPEQARGDAVDARTDQFAAAVMLYEMITHERFYFDMTTHQIWQIVGHGGYRPKSFSTLPPELATILDKALAGILSHRYSSCDEFRDALDAYRTKKHPGFSRRTVRALVDDLFAQQRIETRALVAHAASAPKVLAPTIASSSPAPTDDSSSFNWRERDGAMMTGPPLAVATMTDMARPAGLAPPTDTDRTNTDARASSSQAQAMDLAPGPTTDEREAMNAMSTMALSSDDHTRTASGVSGIEAAWQTKRAPEPTDVIRAAPSQALATISRLLIAGALVFLTAAGAMWMSASDDRRTGDVPQDTPRLTTDTPKTDTPTTDTPTTDAPSTDTPTTDAPSTDTPSTDTPIVANDDSETAPSTKPRQRKLRPTKTRKTNAGENTPATTTTKPAPDVETPPVTLKPVVEKPTVTPAKADPPPPKSADLAERVRVVLACKKTPSQVKALLTHKTLAEIRVAGTSIVDDWFEKCSTTK